MDAWLETSSAARRPLLAEDDLGVEPEGVDLGHPHDVAAAEQADEAAHVQQVVGGVPVPAAVHGDVEHGDAAGAQRALHLGGEAVRVQRVVEDVGELEVEGGVGEGLRVEVAAGDERRRRGRARGTRWRGGPRPGAPRRGARTRPPSAASPASPTPAGAAGPASCSAGGGGSRRRNGTGTAASGCAGTEGRGSAARWWWWWWRRLLLLLLRRLRGGLMQGATRWWSRRRGRGGGGRGRGAPGGACGRGAWPRARAWTSRRRPLRRRCARAAPWLVSKGAAAWRGTVGL